jgi:two-component system, OmpR family, response regulator
MHVVSQHSRPGANIVAGYILVVEDDKHVQQFVNMALSKEGYEVVMADDGQAALDVIKQRSPALILLDIWMPNMDGYTFLTEYCANMEQDIPVVVMTADSVTFENQEAQATFNGILIKPFGFDDLLNCVQQHVGLPGPEAAV